jgi:hypothetical protein
MAVKAHHELGYLERTGSGRVTEKRKEKQDWLFLIGVNHLFAGMEAFVAASLYDFPADLHVQRLESGQTGIGVTLKFGRKP